MAASTISIHQSELLAIATAQDKAFQVSPIELFSLMGHYYLNEYDFDARERFGELLGDIRTDHKLGDQPVLIAHAGTHTTLVPTGDSTAVLRQLPISEEAVKKYTAQRSDRKLGALAYAYFKHRKDVKVIWLAEAFPDLRPGIQGTPFHRGLANHVRAMLFDHKKPVLEARKSGPPARLAVPSIPCICYLAEQPIAKSERYYKGFRIFNGGAYRKRLYHGQPYSSTDMLLDDFIRSGRAKTAKRAILLKLAPSDLLIGNPLDPPIVRRRHMQKAEEAGIEAVLLDSRVGIVDPTPVRPPAKGPRRAPPIYAVGVKRERRQTDSSS